MLKARKKERKKVRKNQRSNTRELEVSGEDEKQGEQVREPEKHAYRKSEKIREVKIRY